MISINPFYTQLSQLCSINFSWIINISIVQLCLYNVSQLNIENASALSYFYCANLNLFLVFVIFFCRTFSYFCFISHFCDCESNWGYQLSVICIFELKIAANASFTYTSTHAHTHAITHSHSTNHTHTHSKDCEQLYQMLTEWLKPTVGCRPGHCKGLMLGIAGRYGAGL